MHMVWQKQLAESHVRKICKTRRTAPPHGQCHTCQGPEDIVLHPPPPPPPPHTHTHTHTHTHMCERRRSMEGKHKRLANVLFALGCLSARNDGVEDTEDPAKDALGNDVQASIRKSLQQAASWRLIGRTQGLACMLGCTRHADDASGSLLCT